MRSKAIKSDVARIDRMRESEIYYSDIPALDKSFLKKATIAWPPTKKQLTIQLDEDVLNWLKGQVNGYQTRINLKTAVDYNKHRLLTRAARLAA